MTTRHLILFVLLSGFLFSAGCKSNPVDPDGTITDGRIIITNDEDDLDDRYVEEDTDVPVDTSDTPNPGIRNLGKQGKAAVIRLRQRGRINPPRYRGTTLQATHVVLDGNYAYVSYNVQGATYLGGVDVIDISNKRRPRLVSQAIFTNTDVSALWFDNGKLYLAEATSDTGFSTPATIEEITLQNNLLTLTSRRVGVPSFVATDVKISNGKVWATSGSGGTGTGGLTVLDAVSLNKITDDLFLDARSVDIENGIVTVMQGTPARLRTYNASTNAFIAEHMIGGANIAESKSVVDVVLDRVFVAAGDEGVKVFATGTGALIDSLPAINLWWKAADLTVTNAVTVSNDLLFAANGEAGVYVAQAVVDMETVPSSDPALSYEGWLNFGGQRSANFVASKNGLLFVASGTGGLRVVEIL